MRVFLIVPLVLALHGCALNRLTKNDALMAVTTLETAAQTAHSTINQDTGLPWLNDRDTNLIVSFCQAAIGAITAQTVNWRNAVAAAWLRFKLTYIVDPQNTILLAAFAALNVLLAPYGG